MLQTASLITHPWCHPNCLSISDEMPRAGDALTYYVVAKVERPLFPGYCAAWEPPTCTYLPFSEFPQVISSYRRLSSASRSRRRSESRIRSELPLCFGSLLVANLILYSLDAGQSLYVGTIIRTHILVWIKHSSIFEQCQP